jgi:YidC/Oxa1 family membrane protein insertase
MLFFIVYGYFMPQPNRAMVEQNASFGQSTTAQHSTTAAPNVTTNNTNAPVVQSTQKQNSAAPVTVSAKKSIASLDAKDFHVEFDELGRISNYTLLDESLKEKDGTQPNLISNEYNLKPLELRFSDGALNEEAFKVPYTSDASAIKLDGDSATITLTQNLSDTTVKKVITFKSNGTYTTDISLSKPSDYFVSPGYRPDISADMYTFKGVLVKKADGTIEKIDDGDAQKSITLNGSMIVSANDRYYTTSFYDFDRGLDAVVSGDSEENPNAFVRGSGNLKLNGYIGPKNYDKLDAIDKRLTDVIEYGFFTFIAKPVFLFLKFLHSIIGNWGWAIVAITLIIRLFLYPLTFKGMVSMNKLKAISPQIKEIQAKHKGDPQKMNAKMMELYKKEGANPMGGCLPMLMQIPVFFAIYRVLLNSIELKDAPWILWIQDLASMDPYYILPVLMAGTMFWQQSITPTNFTDPMQEKIMKFLPLIFMFFFITFPAGLTLYWFVNNMFSVAQQYYVNKIFDKEKQLKKAES